MKLSLDGVIEVFVTIQESTGFLDVLGCLSGSADRTARIAVRYACSGSETIRYAQVARRAAAILANRAMRSM